MRTRSILTLSLSPVGLLLLYGLGDIVNGASDPAAATSTPEATVNQAPSSTQSGTQTEAVRPTPSPVEAKSQPEFSAAPAPPPSSLPLAPSNSQPPSPIPPLPAMPNGRFELATIRVDATKLDRVIHRSFGSNPVLQGNSPPVTVASIAPTSPAPALAAVAPGAIPAVVPVSASPPPSAPEQSATTTREILQPRPESASILTPDAPLQLDAIQYIASSGVAAPETFQLTSMPLTEAVDRPVAPTASDRSETTLFASALSVSALSTVLQSAPLTVHSDPPSESQSSAQQSPQPAAIAQMSPTPSVPTPGNLVNNNESYILGPGDIIQTNFFNVPEYNGTVQVMPDGTVNLPVVGSVTVSGMTLKQAGEAIGAQYASELNYLVVSVSLVQPRPLQIALVGEIAQPGLYSIAANAGGQFPAVVQAIQTAGGATQAANLQQVEIRRRDQAGRVRTMTVNLLALLQQGDLSQNSLLQDGDVIFIPAATEIRLADANQLAISNLRSTTDIPLDVSVVGEVLRPGPYRMEGGGGRSTLVQAIQQAGGFTPSADLSQIQLRRKTRQGTEQVVNINLWQVLQTGDLEQDLVLQQGDTVMIPTARELTATETAALTGSSLSTGSIRVNILGEVESPGAQELQANTTLNQALLSAGGFNGRARGKVKLIRFNPNGTLAQQEINIDLTQELNSATNPILRNNDVILVGRSTGARLRDTLSEVLDIFGLISPLIPF